MSEIRGCSKCKSSKLLSYFAINVKGQYFKTCNKCRGKTGKLAECRKFAKTKRGECLSEVYTGSQVKMSWKCQNNHIWNATSNKIKNNGTWCPVCVGHAKLNIEECQAFAKNKGGLCLSEVYVNAITHMSWQCSENHIWQSRFDSIKNGSWCPECIGVKKHTIEECQAFAKNKDGLCLSETYVNAGTHMSWQCSEKHIWSSTFRNIKNTGSWCPVCVGHVKLNIEECQAFAKNKGGECLSEVYTDTHNKMSWKCENNHIWEARFNSIKSGGWCPECVRKKKLTIEECQEYAISKGGKCLSETYVNGGTHMSWQCRENHTWNATFRAIKSGGSWCPNCSSGRSENLCREIFEKLLMEPFNKMRPIWLEKLELDGYNEELNIAFEYNGIQHYEYTSVFHNNLNDLELQQLRDFKKYSLCKKKGINLIIIPYQYSCQKPKELEDYIINELWKIC